MTRSASDLMETWLQLVAGATGVMGSSNLGLTGGRASVPPGPSGNGRDSAPGTRWTDPPPSPTHPSTGGREAAPGSPAGKSDDARVRIEVQASCPTEVFLDLRAGASRRPLRVHALRSVDADNPRLEATITRGTSPDEPSVLRVQVPPDHPPGTYHGLILDEEANRPLGALSVKVLSAANDASP
jgi:hypothetical protein